MTPVVTRLPDGHPWLRVADPGWADPLDPSYAEEAGGRWNPPGSFPALYLNADVDTARAQVDRLLQGQPVRPEDLADPGFVLVVATLPRGQEVADAASAEGLRALGLPEEYPYEGKGLCGHDRCRPVGEAVHERGLRGVSCRSAALPDRTARELAWFPARRSSRATSVGDPLPFSAWWYADSELPPRERKMFSRAG